MKLRINGNAIRLRLSQMDLATFAETGRLAETVAFPAGAELQYVLEASPDTDRFDTTLHDHTLVVHCPQAWVADWVDTDRVGFEAAIPLDGGETLHLLVEKDFECLHRPTAATADAFPHPDARGDDA